MEINCRKCGECCKRLYMWDRISVSLRSKKVMLSKKCKFLGQDNLCKIHEKRPGCCRDWSCGLACGVVDQN